MLSTMRNSWLLFAVLALSSLSSTLNIDQALHIDGIEAYLHQGVKRQAQGTGGSASEPASTPTDNPQTSAEETPSPTPTQAPSQTEDSSSDGPSQTPAPSSNPPASSDSRPPSTPAPNSTPASTSAPSRTSQITTPVVKTSALVATSVQQYTTVYTTISNGQSVAVTSTGESTALITTGTATTTEMPLPQNGSGASGSGGLSDTNKKIIGGVVGGVGGAILLGGIAVVCWRIWGRKKRVAEDDDDLMAGTGSALGDKPTSSTGNTPFQSNLDQYHTPGGRPNAAANF